MTNLKINIRTFIGDTESIQYDIDAAISDLQYRLDGGTTHYIVDTSEISAYIKGEYDNRGMFHLFDDQGEHHNLLFQQNSLHLLFYGVYPDDPPPLLIAPYRAELKILANGFTKTQNRRNQWLLLLQEVYDILKRQDLKYLKTLKDKLAHSSSISDLSEIDIKEITNFHDLNSNILHTVRYLREAIPQPLERLETLFDRDRLIYLEHRFPEFELSDQLEIENRWVQAQKLMYNDLESKPNLEDSINKDASAVGILTDVNDWLLKQENRQDRVRLITRSTRMLDIYRRERHKYWSKYDFPLLSHPRVIPLQTPETINNAESDKYEAMQGRLEYLQTMRDSVEELLLNINPENMLTPLLFDNNHPLWKNIVLIRNSWLSIEGWITSLNAVKLGKSTSLGDQIAQDIVADALELIDYLLNIENLNNLAVAQISRQTKTILKTNQVLTELMSQPTIQSMPHTIKYNRSELQTVIQYLRLQFSGMKVTHKLSESFEKALSQILDKGDAELQYEKTLAYANFYTIVGEWERAEKLLQELVYPKTVVDEVSTKEARFLLAICLRKQNPTPSNNLEAIRILDGLIDISPNDPRYIKEKAVNIIYLHHFYKYTQFNIETDMIPSLEQAINLLDQAFDLIDIINPSDEEIPLIIQIQQNRLYSYVMRETGLLSRNTVENAYRSLNYWISQKGGRSLSFVPSIEMTLCWARWILNGPQLDGEEIRHLVKRINRASESPEIHKIQREAFERRSLIIELKRFSQLEFV